MNINFTIDEDASEIQILFDDTKVLEVDYSDTDDIRFSGFTKIDDDAAELVEKLCHTIITALM